MLKLFGIPNCNSVKKTRNWLDSNKINYEFHDFKQQGITKKQLLNWCNTVGWEKLLNKRSRTWKELCKNELKGKDRSNLTQIKAIILMQQHPTLIKRPVIQKGKTIEIGFDIKSYNKHFK